MTDITEKSIESMDKEQLRGLIDEIDDRLVGLFASRMSVCAQIARFKKENDLPVMDMKREREKLKAVVASSPVEIREYSSLLYSLMFELSRSYQNSLIGKGSWLAKRIEEAVEKTPKLFP